MQETLVQQFQQTGKKPTVVQVSKDYNLTLRAANTLLKEMDAQGLFAKQAQAPLADSTSQPQPADEDFTLGEDAQPREEAPILGAEAQPIKDEPFTLGDEKKQPTRREFPHVSQPIKLTDVVPSEQTGRCTHTPESLDSGKSSSFTAPSWHVTTCVDFAGTSVVKKRKFFWAGLIQKNKLTIPGPTLGGIK